MSEHRTRLEVDSTGVPKAETISRLVSTLMRTSERLEPKRKADRREEEEKEREREREREYFNSATLASDYKDFRF